MIGEGNNKESETRFLTPKARLAFAKWRQAFTIAPILDCFDLEC